MEQQRLQLENLKLRMQNGETVQSTRMVHGEYIVQLTNDPEMTFDGNFKPTVDNTIRKAQNGIRENTLGNDTAPGSSRQRPDLDTSQMPIETH